MEFQGINNWDQVDVIKYNIRRRNNYLLKKDKLDLLSRGEISLAEYGKICKNINLFYSLPFTETRTRELIKDEAPTGDPVTSINQYILKVGIRTSVEEGYIALEKLDEYYAGYRILKNRKLNKRKKKTKKNDYPEFNLQARLIESIDDVDLGCYEDLNFDNLV